MGKEFDVSNQHGKPAEAIVRERQSDILIFGEIEPYREKPMARIDDVISQDDTLEKIENGYSKRPDSDIEGEYLRGAGRDIIATQYTPDGEPNGLAQFEVKADLSGKAIFRTNQDRDLSPILQIELAHYRDGEFYKPGWLYQYFYANKYNEEYYKPGETYASHPNQIIFLLCYDREGKRPYASICVRTPKLYKCMNEITDGKIERWRYNSRYEWRKSDTRRGIIQNINTGIDRWQDEKGKWQEAESMNKMLFLPVDAITDAQPKVRVFNCPKREPVELDYPNEYKKGKWQYPVVTFERIHFAIESNGKEPDREAIALNRFRKLETMAEFGKVLYYGTALENEVEAMG